jgi:hypothetical protein
MILKSREQKYLPHVMKLQDYQDLCNPGFDGYNSSAIFPLSLNGILDS